MSIDPAASPDQATAFLAPAESPAQPARRVEAVDALRGAVMILMVLDHTRDYFGNMGIEPTDPVPGESRGLFPDTVGDPLLLRPVFAFPWQGRVLISRPLEAGRGATSRCSSLRGESG